MASHMEKVAKLLGVELNEIFFIYHESLMYPRNSNFFRLTEKCIEWSDDIRIWNEAPSAIIGWILHHAVVIVKKWKPKKNEAYYFPCPDSDQLWGCDKWEDCDDDYHRLKHGLVLKSIGEAVEVANQMLVAVQEVRDNG